MIYNAQKPLVSASRPLGASMLRHSPSRSPSYSLAPHLQPRKESNVNCRACKGPIGPAGDLKRRLCSRCAFEAPLTFDEPLPAPGLPQPFSVFSAEGFRPLCDPSAQGELLQSPPTAPQEPL